MYTFSNKPWDPALRGPSYQNPRSDTSFELLAARAATPTSPAMDAPAVFAEAFEAAYGPSSAKAGQDPMYGGPLKANSMPAIGYATLVLVQKMVEPEAAQSSDVATILNAAASMATPSMYGLASFDRYGRTTKVSDVLQQLTPDGQVIITPYNIGRSASAVFPLPSWAERSFRPVKWATSGEQVVAALNGLCMLVCLVLMVLVGANYRAAVIRAATPSFCLVTILGAMLMLASVFFSSLVVSDADCAAQV